MNKKQLYLFVAIFSVAGMLWVALNAWAPPAVSMPDICLFKKVTGLPCPACGSTHALLSLAAGHPLDALYMNPFAFLLAAGLIGLPLWTFYDFALKKGSFYVSYLAAESFIRRRWVSATLILLIAANWAWNIYKFTAQ